MGVVILYSFVVRDLCDYYVVLYQAIQIGVSLLCIHSIPILN